MKKSFTDLIVWQKAVALSIKIYKITESFPKSEIYGLTNQIRRSSVSIPSNISEGALRNSNKEFVQFLSIALGSTAELKTQIIIAKGVGFLSEQDYKTIFEELEGISRMTLKLKSAIK